MWYSSDKGSPTGLGRPRDAGTTRKILERTIDLLTEVGYSGTSITAVAARAGVGTKSVYRRYANRDEMIVEAISTLMSVDQHRISGNPHSDLTEIIESLRANYLHSDGGLMSAELLSEMNRKPELIASFRREIVWPKRRMMKSVLEQAMRQGKVERGVDLELVADQLWGAILGRSLSGLDVPQDYVGDLVNSVFHGIATKG